MKTKLKIDDEFLLAELQKVVDSFDDDLQHCKKVRSSNEDFMLGRASGGAHVLRVVRNYFQREQEKQNTENTETEKEME